MERLFLLLVKVLAGVVGVARRHLPVLVAVAVVLLRM
jgi:hypothetical protein